MMYIGLDVGTSGCKASVMDEKGNVSATSSREYSFEFPALGYVELNPATVFRAVEETLRELAPKAQAAKAIAVSSIGETMVMLDAKDNVLTNGIVYLDQRCTDTVDAIAEKIPREELFGITLTPLNPMFSLNKILWYRKNMPGLLEKADKIFLFCDYINYMLCGKRAIDPGTASRTMFFDAVNNEWSEKIATIFDVPIKKFSDIVRVGTNLGPIMQRIAETTGLPKQLEVIMGGHDQMTATLGSGAYQAGYSILGEGTSESLNLVIDKNNVSPKVLESGFGYEPYISDELYMVPVGQLSHGVDIRWFVKMFQTEYEKNRKENESLYVAADRLCAKESKELYFLPWLSKSNATDSTSKALGGFFGMELTTERDTMYRALLEGLGFETRTLVELLESYGLKMEKIVAAGGGSKSPLFMQIKSDILGRTIDILRNAESGIAGLGMICAVACHEYESYEQAAKEFVAFKANYEPIVDMENDYKNYVTISRTVKNLYKQLI